MVNLQLCSDYVMLFHMNGLLEMLKRIKCRQLSFFILFFFTYIYLLLSNVGCKISVFSSKKRVTNQAVIYFDGLGGIFKAK